MTAEIVLDTERLVVRQANVDDAAFYLALWRNPRVMHYVGFPQGLRITLAEIETKLAQQPAQWFDRMLVVVEKASGQAIGECKMYLPDDQGISRTDVKLLPSFWGHKYGVEIKQALVDHLFTHTACHAVEGSPNVQNVASIMMQKAVGGVPVREETYTFPESMQSFTQPVHSIIYLVYRTWWEEHRKPDLLPG